MGMGSPLGGVGLVEVMGSHGKSGTGPCRAALSPWSIVGRAGRPASPRDLRSPPPGVGRSAGVLHGDLEVDDGDLKRRDRLGLVSAELAGGGGEELLGLLHLADGPREPRIG